ncbi:MAG: endonuclease/exonuclease/phosphatase family protein, partial [Propionibacteriales bacterium]|nr:endonuclease/exonuclease/phosphatase family protein [Propionibacteriales bacterium]
MRIATWNVNSIRARLDRVVDWLEATDVDVLAIQETKCRDDQFPGEVFEGLGYAWAHHGTSQWNGVAVVSRVGLADVETTFPGQPHWGDPPAAEARALGATCARIRVWSLYVPNGRELGHPHLAYKLGWLEALRTAGLGWLGTDPGAQIALTGDWNIAPYDEDVWDMAAFTGSTHVSPPERASFSALLDAGFTDVVRPYTPGPG